MVIDSIQAVVTRDPDVLAFVMSDPQGAVPNKHLHGLEPVIEKAKTMPFKSLTVYCERANVFSRKRGQQAVVLIAKQGNWSEQLKVICRTLILQSSSDESLEPCLSAGVVGRLQEVLLDEVGFAAEHIFERALKNLGVHAKKIPVGQIEAFLNYLELDSNCTMRIRSKMGWV
jgi:hypothetical protein